MKKFLIIFLLPLLFVSCSKEDLTCSFYYTLRIRKFENFVNRYDHKLEISWKIDIYGLCKDREKIFFNRIKYAVFEIENQSVSYTYCIDSVDIKKSSSSSNIIGDLLIDWSTYEMQSNGQLGILIDLLTDDLTVGSFYYLGNYRTDHEYIEFLEIDTNDSINQSMREAITNE